ncbi:MAG: hypothetical protein LBB87_01265 [Nitrososphaerota archaeon]|nr:hypothetical protein [Nitrososphaerota archaeon]
MSKKKKEKKLLNAFRQHQWRGNDIYALQTFMGIKNINSLTPYVDGHWERYTKNILNAKIT